MSSYRIVRFHAGGDKRQRTIARGLTLEQAQQHCSREDTHRIGKDGRVLWFDGYTEE
jgi:hypothetical protein